MSKAIVVFSGGQDSTTCLCWALKKFGQSNVVTVTFDYFQRNRLELESVKKICSILNVPNKSIILDVFYDLGKNALVTDMEIGINQETNLPNTFVPGRNMIFLSYAAIYAYNIQANHIVTGVCETDYSGYPDCRRSTIDALENALRLGMDCDLSIHTPLMFLNKKQTVELMSELGYLELLKYTYTCYEGKNPPCGLCPSCVLRAKGFKEAGIQDPIFSNACL